MRRQAASRVHDTVDGIFHTKRRGDPEPQEARRISTVTGRRKSVGCQKPGKRMQSKVDYGSRVCLLRRTIGSWQTTGLSFAFSKNQVACLSSRKMNIEGCYACCLPDCLAKKTKKDKTTFFFCSLLSTVQGSPVKIVQITHRRCEPGSWTPPPANKRNGRAQTKRSGRAHGMNSARRVEVG